MVYKVSGEFTNENLNKFIGQLNKRYKIILKEESIYLALMNYSAEVDFDDRNDIGTIQNSDVTKDRLTKELKTKIFIPLGDFFVKDLTLQKNIEHEDEFIQSWVRENLNRLAKEIYEVENQIELRLMMNQLNILEDELERKAKEAIKPQESMKESGENEGT